MDWMFELFKAAASWLKIDEIRIPRSAGRLLRINLHDRLLILDTVYYVVSREERTFPADNRPIELVYHLNEDLDYTSEQPSLSNWSGLLVVPIAISNRFKPIAYLVWNDRATELEEGDIQVLAHDRSKTNLRPEPYSDD